MEEAEQVFTHVKDASVALIQEFLSQSVKAIEDKRFADAGNMFMSIGVMLDLFLKADQALKVTGKRA